MPGKNCGASALKQWRKSEADYMSPGGASMSCSPQPAALHIAPAARLRGFCLYDSAPGELLCEGDGDLPCLAAFASIVSVQKQI
jgi:hypothetical protein